LGAYIGRGLMLQLYMTLKVHQSSFIVFMTNQRVVPTTMIQVLLQYKPSTENFSVNQPPQRTIFKVPTLIPSIPPKCNSHLQV
jgi:hypothetical protein